MTRRLLDISRPLDVDTYVWPGDQPLELGWSARMDRGAECNVGCVRMSLHAGTHVDLPRHFRADGVALSELDLDVWIGPARVIDARNREKIDTALLANLDTPWPQRVLFRTESFEHPEPGMLWTGIDLDAALALIDAGVRLVGVDTPSVDAPDRPDHPVHRALADAGRVNVENLRLTDVIPGDYELISLPLNFSDMEASPVRAVLRELR